MYIHPKKLNKYPWWLKLFFWKQKRKYGQLLTPALIWGRSPTLFATVALLYGAIDRKSSPIEPDLRSLVTVRVSQINWCPFCVDINSHTYNQRTGSLDKINALKSWKESDLYTDREKAVLAYTDAVTYTDQKVTDAIMENLRRYFNEDEIVELTGLIAFQNLSSKFNSALDIPPQGFCQRERGDEQ